MNFKKIKPQPIADAHAYTQSKSSWLLDRTVDASSRTKRGDDRGWRLFHYLSGGGIREFGRSVQQEEADLNRGSFLWKAAILGLIWFIFWIF